MDDNKRGISLDDIMNAADLNNSPSSNTQSAGQKVKIGGSSASASQSSAVKTTSKTNAPNSKATLGGSSSGLGLSLDDLKSAAVIDNKSHTPSEQTMRCHCPKCNNEFERKYTGNKPTSVFCNKCGWDVMKPYNNSNNYNNRNEQKVQLTCKNCGNGFMFTYFGNMPQEINCPKCGKNALAKSVPNTTHTESLHCPKCENDFEFSYKGNRPKEINCPKCGENVLEAKHENKKKIKSIKNFYLFDLFSRMIESKNWGLLAWIIINFVIIEAVFGVILNVWGIFLVGPLAYFISLAIALSPLGEELLRISNGCRKIKSKNIRSKIEPVFNEVYSRAKEKDPSISPKIELYICDEESENAFATGRRTVCITKGLAKMDSEHIAGVLAHEFGHLSHKDTDSLLIVVVGNLFMTIISTVLGFLCNLTGGILDAMVGDDDGIGCFSIISKGITFLLTTAFMFLWTKLGALFCLKGGRKQEFAADHFAAELGYAQNLIDAFVEMESAPAPKGLWATLLSTHPDTADRIMELEEYIEENQQALA